MNAWHHGAFSCIIVTLVSELIFYFAFTTSLRSQPSGASLPVATSLTPFLWISRPDQGMGGVQWFVGSFFRVVCFLGFFCLFSFFRFAHPLPVFDSSVFANSIECLNTIIAHSNTQPWHRVPKPPGPRHDVCFSELIAFSCCKLSAAFNHQSQNEIQSYKKYRMKILTQVWGQYCCYSPLPLEFDRPR